MQNRRTLIIGSVVGIIVIIAAVAAFLMWGGSAKQEVSTDDPTDIVHGFYQSWLEAAQSTSTTPYKEGLEKNPLLSKVLRTHLVQAQPAKDGIDPVLCQTVIPAKIVTRVVYQLTDKTQILVTASKATTTQQAIVTLLPLNGGWYINDIQCSAGDIAPVREFSFDTDGYFLKGGTKPLDAKYWYLVFEENGEKGHYAPLLFGADSMCTALDGSTAVCTPDTLVQASKAHIQGQMTETGVNVKKVQMLK